MRTHCPPHNVGGPPTLFSTNNVSPAMYIGGGGEPHDILVSATILIKVGQQLPPVCSSFKVGGVEPRMGHNNVTLFAKTFVMIILIKELE